MLTNNEEILDKKPGRIWSITCAVFCIGLFAGTAFDNKQDVGSFLTNMIFDLPKALFPAILLHLIFRTRESVSTSWLGFALIYASLVAGSTMAYNRQKQEIHDFAIDMKQLISQAQANGNSPSAALIRTPTVTSNSSDTAKLFAIIRKFVNRILSQRNGYQTEIEAIHLSGFLDAQRLQHDRSLAESRLMIQRASDIVEKHKQVTTEIFVQARKEIESADLSEYHKQDALSQFDKAMIKSKATIMEAWELEAQVLQEFSNIINLLSSHRNQWQVDNKRLLFGNQSDLDLFNSYVSTIKTLADKEQAIRTASLSQSQLQLQQLSHDDK